MSTDSVRHPLFSRLWAWTSPMMDRGGASEYRRRLLEGLSGEVLEVGAGNGLNFAHYPAEVTAVLAIEPEPYLREAARTSAAKASAPIRVAAGVAERLPVASQSFDAVICSLVLCSVTNQARALQEARRVLRPGGQPRFFEHV